MSYCPFQPPIVEEPTEIERAMGADTERTWQKCGEACALYSTKLQECVFSTIANRLGDIAESLNCDANTTAEIFRAMNEIGGQNDGRTE